MDVRYNERDGCAIFYIDTNIELFVADDLKQNILRIIKENEFRKVILNLDNVDFMDSMGIAMLLQVMELSVPRISMRICNAHSSIQRLLEVTNLYKLIPVDIDEDTSVKRLQEV